MPTLKERLTIVMEALKWDHAKLVQVSGMSSSVVSQWLGHGSKDIHSIGNLEAALRLQEASGFSALWLAKGIGPKQTGPQPSRSAHTTLMAQEQPAAPYYNALSAAISAIAAALARETMTTREAAGSLLRSLAERPDEAPAIGRQLAALLDSGKQAPATRRSA